MYGGWSYFLTFGNHYWLEITEDLWYSIFSSCFSSSSQILTHTVSHYWRIFVLKIKRICNISWKKLLQPYLSLVLIWFIRRFLFSTAIFEVLRFCDTRTVGRILQTEGVWQGSAAWIIVLPCLVYFMHHQSSTMGPYVAHTSAMTEC